MSEKEMLEEIRSNMRTMLGEQKGDSIYHAEELSRIKGMCGGLLLLEAAKLALMILKVLFNT